MPYNSSAFEKQLAAFKKKQGGTTKTNDDAHLARPRVTIGRGEVVAANTQDPPISIATTKKQDVPDDTPLPDTLETKPFYKQGWFLFLFYSAVLTAVIPLAFSKHLGALMQDDSSMALFTQSSPPQQTAMPISDEQQPASPRTIAPLDRLKPAIQNVIETVKARQQGSVQAQASIQSPADIHGMVDDAMRKASEISAQGPEQSMQYIQNEAERLDAMAKEFDAKNRH